MKSSQADSHFTAEQNPASATACATTILDKDVTERTRTIDTQYCRNVFLIFFTGKITNMKTASALFLMVQVSDEENH
jgi:hypothetical protein